MRRLRIKHQLNVAPIIATLTGKLTHLEVLAPWGEAGETSLFEIVLGTCGLLESFRVMGCSMQTHSVYFRQYPRSLPLLRDFAVCLPPDPLAAVDPDLFPAICDFLRDRPMLESLELISSDFEIDQPAFGFDTHVWEFLSSLQHLRILSTRTLDEIPHQRMVELLPRLLTTLTVSMCSWHLERMLQKVRLTHWLCVMLTTSNSRRMAGRMVCVSSVSTTNSIKVLFPLPRRLLLACPLFGLCE